MECRNTSRLVSSNAAYCLSLAVMKATLLDTYRRVWCWQDEWYDLDRAAVRRMEADTVQYLERMMRPEQEPQPCREKEPDLIIASESNLIENFDDVFSSTELTLDSELQEPERAQEDSREEEFVDALEA